MPEQQATHPLVCLHEQDFGTIKAKLDNIMERQKEITHELEKITEQAHSSAKEHTSKAGDINSNLVGLAALVKSQSSQLQSIAEWAIAHDDIEQDAVTEYAVFKKSCELCVANNKAAATAIEGLTTRLSVLERYRTVIIGIISILGVGALIVECIVNSKAIISWFIVTAPK